MGKLRSAIGCLVAVLVCACDEPVADLRLEEQTVTPEFRQWKLPARLREISGLALTTDERLLAVTDEIAIVYELDFLQGRVVKSFALGDPVVRGDFEGIALLNDVVWLLTSDGTLYATAEGTDGSSMTYSRHETGLGDYCEFEGLAADKAAGSLLLSCKNAKRKKNVLKIFELSVSGSTVQQVRSIDLPEKAIEKQIDKKRINPSGISIDPRSGEWVLVAARQDALVRLTPAGELSGAIILKKKGRHRQAEGIEITADGRLLIADEGGDGRARLAVYAAGWEAIWGQ
ncbi:MAG: SdiA-regulated domain-containing protein [Woeseiaceae bacterium]|nr:SdiA-regulated domain-containing protein [Woeseiaceae bacterium]